MKVATASVYCSRNRASAIASRNGRLSSVAVYQAGRGSDPVMVAGSVSAFVAVSMGNDYIVSARRMPRQLVAAALILTLALPLTTPRAAAREALPSRLTDHDFWKLS